MNALSQIQQAWLFQPQKLMEAQAELWQRYWQLWTSALAILTSGGTAEPVATPDPKDARFKDPSFGLSVSPKIGRGMGKVASRYAPAEPARVGAGFSGRHDAPFTPPTKARGR
jgi:hypothetical protein